jgi:hypothetical protein
MAAADDERPPIIVRGGSLIIQSGDGKSSNPKHKIGKQWKKDAKEYRQIHDNGKHVARYSVSFVGGGAACTPDFATDVRVSYQTHSGEKVTIQITRREKSGSNKTEPVVLSDKDLSINNDIEQPTLTLPDEGGKILSISIGSKVCSEPVSAKLQPIK